VPSGEFHRAPSALKRHVPVNTSKKKGTMTTLLPGQLLRYPPVRSEGWGRGTPDTLQEGRRHPHASPRRCRIDRDFSRPPKNHAPGGEIGEKGFFPFYLLESSGYYFIHRQDFESLILSCSCYFVKLKHSAFNMQE
jgi:hypothetical protein